MQTPGKKAEVDRLFVATYEELRRLAARVRASDPSQTLNPTALVNEAYLKLADTLRIVPASRLHFKRLAARAMRQVLIEAARRRSALKRGADFAFVTLNDGDARHDARSTDLLALDAALERLASVSNRQALLVEYRYFGGLEVAEIAESLEISESTVLRDWRAAKAWLAHELSAAG
jgi:RNA polymerase sigma factor (TIGR02999 family)